MATACFNRRRSLVQSRYRPLEESPVCAGLSRFDVASIGDELRLSPVNVLVVDRTRVVGEWDGVLLKGKCLPDLKAKRTPVSAYGICAVIPPPNDLRKSQP